MKIIFIHCYNHFFFVFRPNQAYRIFNTWMGDPGKVLVLEKILEIIKRDNLLKVVENTGNKLKKQFLELENEFPNLLNSTRGRGTFLAVNCTTTALRDEIIHKMKQKGNYNILYIIWPNSFCRIIINKIHNPIILNFYIIYLY